MSSLIQELLLLIGGTTGLAILFKTLGPSLVGWLSRFATPESVLAAKQAADVGRLASEAAIWKYANETITAQDARLAICEEDLRLLQVSTTAEISKLRTEYAAEVQRARVEAKEATAILRAEHADEVRRSDERRGALEKVIEELKRVIGELRDQVTALQAENKELRARRRRRDGPKSEQG